MDSTLNPTPCGSCRTMTDRFLTICIKDGEVVTFAACVAFCDVCRVEAVNRLRQPALDAQAISHAPSLTPGHEEPVEIQRGETLIIRDGCIDQAEIRFESHRRGRNWIATVTPNKAIPGAGGLERTFWTKTTTSWRKVPEDLQIGDVLEVAAEYVSGSGKNDRDRVYRRVRSIGDGIITLDVTTKPS